MKAKATAWLLVGLLTASLVGAHPASGATEDAATHNSTADRDRIRALVLEGHFAEAETQARQLLDLAVTQYGADSLEAAIVMDGLAEAIRRGGENFPEARAIVERALDIKQSLLGPEHPEVARSLDELARWCVATGERAEARELLERELAILERVHGPEHPDVAHALQMLAFCQKEFAAARPLLERALEIFEKTRGPDHPNVGSVLVDLANLLVNLGEPTEQSRQLLERALFITERAHGPDHVGVAESLRALGYLCMGMADYDEAHRLWVREQNIYRRLGLDLEVAKTYVNLGILMGTRGDGPGGAAQLERAAAIFEQIQGPDGFDVGMALGNLAMFRGGAGEFAAARDAYERAAKIFERGGERGVYYSLKLRSGLAQTLADMGDYDEAREVLERVVARMATLYDVEHQEVALMQTKLAAMLALCGEPDDGWALFESARDNLAAALGSNHPEIATVTRRMVAALRHAGDRRDSRVLSERALAIFEDVYGPESGYVADVLVELGHAQQRFGDYAGARASFERALAIHTDDWGPDHLVTGTTLAGLAAVLAGSGDDDAALEAGLRSVDIVRDSLRLTTRSLPERQALRYAAAKGPSLDVVLSVVARGPTASRATLALGALVRSRALVRDEMAARNRTSVESEDVELATLVDRFAVARQRVVNLFVAGMGTDPPRRYLEMLTRAQQEREAAERELARKSPRFREVLKRADLTVGDVSEALPPGSALVSFVRYREYGPAGQGSDAARREAGEHPRHYLAFVLRPRAGAPVVVPLGSAARLESVVARWGQEAAHGTRAAGRSPEDAEAAYRAAATALRQHIWDPLVPFLKEADRLFVVPDAALHRVSLAGLPVGGDGWLVDAGPLVYYLSAERDLVATERNRTEGLGMLLLGNPDYDTTSAFLAGGSGDEPTQPSARVVAAQPFRGARSGCGDLASLEFEALPASSREAKGVLGIWRKSAEKNEEADLLLGARASETAFKTLAPGKRVLHVAAHGFFLEGRCPSLLSPQDPSRGYTASDLPPAVGENPQLLTGLALAGANHRSLAGLTEDDGILTAEEVAALDLSTVELAVLSACDTGLGQVAAGEGLFGLRRAFHIAGVRSLVVSLWPVDDKVTREWMLAFYRHHFGQRSDAAEAIRGASLDILNRRRARHLSTHPFYWSGFVAAGRPGHGTDDGAVDSKRPVASAGPPTLPQ